jgi:thymidylate kinase
MIHIIAIEGLDGSGKTYLTEKLTDDVREKLDDAAIVESCRFPHDRAIVDTANKLLLSPGNLDFRDYLNLVELFANDRLKWWYDINNKYAKEMRDVVVLADRYILSNPLYNVPSIIKSQYMSNTKKRSSPPTLPAIVNDDIAMDTLSKFLTKIVLNYDARNRKPEGTIFLDTNHSIRMQRLNRRDFRDAYELSEMITFQEKCMKPVMEKANELKYIGSLERVTVVPNDVIVNHLADFVLRTIRCYGADC